MRATQGVAIWLVSRYEAYALETGTVPTITSMVRTLTRWQRVGVWAGFATFLFFHFDGHRP